jgi:hypothetical protein
MPSYERLKEMISHRVTFDYDTGARVVGYLATCKPAQGPVQLVVLSRAEISDRDGNVLERHEQLSLVPNALAGVRLTEGPS